MPSDSTARFALGELAAQLGAELIGNPARIVSRISPLESATPEAISFLSNPRYLSQLADSQAGCVIAAPAHREAAAQRGDALIAADPYLCFARLTQLWAARARDSVAAVVHPSAVVHPQAQLGRDVSVGALAVIEQDVVIGDGAVIGAQCFVGAGASVGTRTRLHPQAVLGAGCHIGARGIVHSGVVIGADGFGFAPNAGRWEKIEQLGGVRIGDDVEIGANTCIDRGALEDTVIEDGVKLDNLVQIAHNVHVGAHTAMAATAAVSGSTRIGAHCTLAGGAGVAGHVTIADHVHIGPRASATRSLLKPGLYSGLFPIDDNASWEKNAATLRQLHQLRDRIRALEKNNENKPS
ncbi:MAG: UDP-3-O-(3-hydroxymyristoyl)glucosamine N-acyltransferase [Burkholderiaceae bacterium]|nr:UDP-3-O-(3-hydroxymyristoyl)glucosamine N-acyltransferase [Burkholderiaceae bacterium]